MPSKKTSIASVNESIVVLDKSIVSDTIKISSQIDILGGEWKLTCNSSMLSLEKKKQCLSYFSPTDGIMVKSIKTPIATLGSNIASGLASYTNSQTDAHHSYGSPVSTDTSTVANRYDVSMSGFKYMRYTPTGLNNTTTISIYQRSPTISNTNAFAPLTNKTFSGSSNMNNSIIRGDYDFDIVFELLPFYNYNNIANSGILRIYSLSKGFTLVQTLSGTNMTDFQVSADGNYIVITSTSADASFKVYKRDSSSKWNLYHSGIVDYEYDLFENVIPVAVARDGSSFSLRGKIGTHERIIIYSNTGVDFKYETELNRFDSSSTSGILGSYSPNGLEFVLSNKYSGVIYVYELIDSKWCKKQQIISSVTGGQSAYNGRFICAIHTQGGECEWRVWGRKLNGLYILIARYPAIVGTINTSPIVDDRDVIHYIHYPGGGNAILKSVYPIGGALGGTTSTRNIFHPDGETSNIGSSTSVYMDVFTKNGIIVTSDRHLKKNIVPINNCMDILNDMKPISYKTNGSSQWHHGFSNEQSIRYSEITPILVGALQSISNRLSNIE